MLFYETNQEWKPIPQWVDYLIRLGMGWPSNVSGRRRIALVSMPCDSPAAGLIALGSIIRDLGNLNANDIDGHFDHLLRYSQQYLENCRFCGPNCKPDITRCGYIERATGRLYSPLYPRKPFIISDKTDLKKRKLAWHYSFGRGKSGVQFPNPKYAKNWYIDGHPPVQLDSLRGQLLASPYSHLIKDATILSQNLCLSWSGLCLAGRVRGEAATREIYASIRFRNGIDEHSLTDLLTVHGWSHRESISRMIFFNPRTDQLDRRCSPPALVVADGDTCLLKVLIYTEFQRSDVLGVIHRTIERDSLEAIGSRMIGLRQWYVEDSETLGRMPPAPRGISISILKKRTT
jgi:hypothetical protein